MGSEEEGWGYVSVEALTAINFASFHWAKGIMLVINMPSLGQTRKQRIA